MNYLEDLRKRLKHKDEVMPEIPLKVHTSEVQKKEASNIEKKPNITETKDKVKQSTNITETKDKVKQSTNITANKDKGELSINILEKIKQQKMSRFSKTHLEEKPQQPSQAHIIEEKKGIKLKKIN